MGRFAGAAREAAQGPDRLVPLPLAVATLAVLALALNGRVGGLLRVGSEAAMVFSG